MVGVICRSAFNCCIGVGVSPVGTEVNDVRKAFDSRLVGAQPEDVVEPRGYTPPLDTLGSQALGVINPQTLRSTVEAAWAAKPVARHARGGKAIRNGFMV